MDQNIEIKQAKQQAEKIIISQPISIKDKMQTCNKKAEEHNENRQIVKNKDKNTQR